MSQISQRDEKIHNLEKFYEKLPLNRSNTMMTALYHS